MFEKNLHLKLKSQDNNLLKILWKSQRRSNNIAKKFKNLCNKEKNKLRNKKLQKPNKLKAKPKAVALLWVDLVERRKNKPKEEQTKLYQVEES